MASAPDVAIVGSGFGGLAAAIALRRAGVEQVTIYERAEALGGTWRDNTYPGAACDVPSNLYSFSFAHNPAWSRRFAPWREIRDYLEACADRFDVRRLIRFGCGVQAARWDGDAARWRLTLDDGSEASAAVLVPACGGLSRPWTPAIPGADDFEGERWHTARWRHDVPVEGKRVGIIGTGASAVQVVPEVAGQAEHLTVFQRTAHWVLSKPDGAVSPRRQRAYAAWPSLQTLARWWTYWRLEWRVLGFVHLPKVMRLVEAEGRAHLKSAVPDPALRARLTPPYTLGCKRVLLSNTYLQALQRPDVSLVTAGIEAITPEGVRTADGVTHPLDVLVYATGFDAAEAGPPFEVTGLAGQSLADAWADAPQAYKGCTVAGFPNLFMLVGPNTGLGHSSMIFMIAS